MKNVLLTLFMITAGLEAHALTCSILMKSVDTVSYPLKHSYLDHPEVDIDVPTIFSPRMLLEPIKDSGKDTISKLIEEHRRKFELHSAQVSVYSFDDILKAETPVYEDSRALSQTGSVDKVTQIRIGGQVSVGWLNPRKVPRLIIKSEVEERVSFTLSRKERQLTKLKDSHSFPKIQISKITKVQVNHERFGELGRSYDQGVLAKTEAGVPVVLYPLESTKSRLASEALSRELGARTEQLFVAEHDGVKYWGTEIPLRVSLDIYGTVGNTHEDHLIDHLEGLSSMPKVWKESLLEDGVIKEDTAHEETDLTSYSLTKSSRLIPNVLQVLWKLDDIKPLFYQQTTGIKFGYGIIVDELMQQLNWYIDGRTGRLGLEFKVDSLSKELSEFEWDGDYFGTTDSPRRAAPYAEDGRNYHELIKFLSVLPASATEFVFSRFAKRKMFKEWWSLVKTIQDVLAQRGSASYATKNLRQAIGSILKPANLKDLSLNGFGSEELLVSHFESHQNDFLNPPSSKEEYLERAVEFLRDEDPSAVTVQRADGKYFKYDSETEEFAVVDFDGRVVTYYILSKSPEDTLRYLGKNVHRDHSR